MRVFTPLPPALAPAWASRGGSSGPPLPAPAWSPGGAASGIRQHRFTPLAACPALLRGAAAMEVWEPGKSRE